LFLAIGLLQIIKDSNETHCKEGVRFFKARVVFAGYAGNHCAYRARL